jgi:hypothetical protein
MQPKAMTLSALAVITLMVSLTPAPAEETDIGGRLAEQSCETQAAAHKLTGAEKDSFIAKCQAEAKIGPPDQPITTGPAKSGSGFTSEQPISRRGE